MNDLEIHLEIREAELTWLYFGLIGVCLWCLTVLVLICKTVKLNSIQRRNDDDGLLLSYFHTISDRFVQTMQL